MCVFLGREGKRANYLIRVGIVVWRLLYTSKEIVSVDIILLIGRKCEFEFDCVAKRIHHH